MNFISNPVSLPNSLYELLPFVGNRSHLNPMQQTLQSGKTMRSRSYYGATDTLYSITRTRDHSEFHPEDDTASWFYSLLDDPFYDRGLAAVPDPPPPPDAGVLPPAPAFQLNQHYSHHQTNPQPVNSKNFGRSRPRFPESGSSASSRNNEVRESAVVDSWLLPDGGCMSLSNDSETCDHTLTSLSGDYTEAPVTRVKAGDRKRKGKEVSNDSISEYQSGEDGKIESSGSKKESGGSAKRSRAAEVRNLAVRKRRNRINEKMRALQELVPRCGKTDKASMLDEAIEYFKSLQLQVQMMSMGCGMVPMMVLGVQQQYMQPMGMGVGTEMGTNRPTTPLSSALAGSGLTTPGAVPSMFVPKYPQPNFPMPNAPAYDSFFNPQGGLQMPQDQPNSVPGTRKQRARRESENNKTQQL